MDNALSRRRARALTVAPFLPFSGGERESVFWQTALTRAREKGGEWASALAVCGRKKSRFFRTTLFSPQCSVTACSNRFCVLEHIFWRIEKHTTPPSQQSSVICLWWLFVIDQKCHISEELQDLTFCCSGDFFVVVENTKCAVYTCAYFPSEETPPPAQ